MNIEDIAKACHNVNTVYCETLGDSSQVPWERAAKWQQTSAINGVGYYLANQNATAADLHQSWIDYKIKDGWEYGDCKNAQLKIHPELVAWDLLSEDAKTKSILFREIVDSLKWCLEKAIIDRIGEKHVPNSVQQESI